MSVCSGAALPEAWLATNFCAETIPVNVAQARSVISVGTTDLLTLERGSRSVILLKDTNGDGLADTRQTVASAPNINHGIALYDGYLYASSDTTVYRWRMGNNFQVVNSAPEVVINNMSGGGHTTRTLEFDAQGRLYVSIGSLGNVDANSFRARIRRFTSLATLPINFESGEVFADGLRNEVGLAFDSHGVLWGVENGADNLFRQDLGGQITDDNPAEELNQFREVDAGKHWGYPWCWSEFSLALGQGPGTVWAWPMATNSKTDAECRQNYQRSALSMQAHSAPLGITFYKWKAVRPVGCKGAFPSSMDGYAFIAFHGSWNRKIPTGYKVVYVKMDKNGNVVPGSTTEDLLMHQPPNAVWPDGFRPVDVDFDECGRLIVSSDGSGARGSKIVRISYSGSSLCFSGNMTVEMEDGSRVPLKELQLGDRVKVDDNRFEPVWGFGHYDETLMGEYLLFQLSSGVHLEISDHHLVFVNERKSVPASSLRIGDNLLSNGEAIQIDSIERVQRKGAYAPFTPSGTILINGVKSSNYVSLQPGSAYLTVGIYETPFSHHWMAHSFLLPIRMMGSHVILSYWVDALRKAGMWLLSQNELILSLCMGPLLVSVSAASAAEYILRQHGMALTIAVLTCYLMYSKKKALRKDRNIGIR